MGEYLDRNGLLYLWQKLVNRFVSKETGKGLSTNDFTTALKEKLEGISAGAQPNVKPDWNAESGTSAEILNKPTIPTASATPPKMNGVAAVGGDSGFARGDHVHPSDTSKANASDVYTKNEIDSKLSSVYKPAGNTTFAALPTPSASNLGNVYSLTESFTTDSRFVASSPTTYPIGTNVVVIADSSTGETKYLYDVLAGFIDLSSYLQTDDIQSISNEDIDEIVA